MRGSLPLAGPELQASLDVHADVPRAREWQEALREQHEEREQMVSAQVEARGIEDPRVLDAMRSVPRHRFVPERQRQAAYTDAPLPIPGDQTISQPYIVAFMSEAAQIAPTDRCLEIGTGSGYQTAVLSELCREVYSVEYLPEVAAFGRSNLAALGYLERGVHLRVADGYSGWPEQAPFDVILVTAAPPHVPRPLLEQLARGGRLVIPVGEERDQNLETWTRRRAGVDDGAFIREISFGVRFVPFLGPYGQ
jgi:protein-L-isoaspartate(D-aspartate) O-methyltransferase